MVLIPALLAPVFSVAAEDTKVSVAGVARPGRAITIRGQGFESRDWLELSWDGRLVSWLPPVRTDRDGDFEVTAELPGSVATGRHSVVIRLKRAGRDSRTLPAVVASSRVHVVRGPSVKASPLASDVATPVAIPAPTRTPRPPSTPRPTRSPSPVASAVVTAAPSSTVPAATPLPIPSPPPPPPAPPRDGPVVGYGAATSGGSGGAQIVVSNLNDSGPGSLRDALSASGARTVVFSVGGTIQLAGDLEITRPNVTIAGETAPSPVVLRGGALRILTSEVVVRHLRLRPGDQGVNAGDADALTINGVNGGGVGNVVVDHVTMLWGPDIGGLAILGDVHDVTVSNSIMGEGLYLSGHPEANASQGGHSHAMNVSQLDSGSAAPARITFWRNLFTTSATRMPRFQGAQCMDMVNNVIYNWGSRAAHGNPASLNLVNNWYRSGPMTTDPFLWFPQTSQVAGNLNGGSVYLAGNTADGFTAQLGSPDTVYAGGVLCGGLSVGADSTQVAYNAVVASAGATLPARDAVDQRVIGNVTGRSGTFFNGAGHPGPNPYWQ